MTPEAQRIAIAEACGWHPYNGAGLVNYQWAPGHISRAVPRWCKEQGNGLDAPSEVLMELPDYLSDLNAMHEAEKVLEAHQLEDYAKCLHGLCEVCDIFATAAQRAEAFLRTLGKWTD